MNFKFYLTIGCTLLAFDMSAQWYWDDVPVLPDSYAQKVSKDGVIVAGEIINGDYYTFNLTTGEVYDYFECHGGMGNSISKNGWLVASNKVTSKGAILYEGKIHEIPSLAKFSESYLYGITWDGTRICGLISNPNLDNTDFTDPSFIGQMYVPVILDIDSDGNIGEPQILPYLRKDFFGASPQYCSAVWISDDGKRIIGQVIDDTGRFIYPIVYNQNEEGEWSYNLPTEHLFNMNKAVIPEYPEFEMPVKQVTDFMNPEKAQEFEKDYEFYVEHNGIVSPEDDPYNNLEFYMTPEELEAYNLWYGEYVAYSDYYINVILEDYYPKLLEVVKGSVFFSQASMALDSSGRYMACYGHKSGENSEQQDGKRFTGPYLFDLNDGTYKIIGNNNVNWHINQILSDGTLIASGTGIGETPVHSAILLPGNNDFIPIEEWLKNVNSDYAEWMEKYLRHDVPIGYETDGITWHYIDMYVTGLVSMSDDKQVIAGGVDGWSWDLESGMYFSYILSNVNANIKNVENIREFNGIYEVYNLQGKKILVTKDLSKIKELSKGIYILNGKKVKI